VRERVFLSDAGGTKLEWVAKRAHKRFIDAERAGYRLGVRMASSEAQSTPRVPGMRGWTGTVARWLFGPAAGLPVEGEPCEPQPRFRNVSISREAGAGGGTIARLVGTRLAWKVYDHELLEAIAHGMEVPVDEVRVFDELAPSMVQDWLLPLREEHYAPQEAYLDHLAKLVESIGRKGEAIVVGRGASWLLPRAETLAVRVVAPLKARAQRLAQRMGVSVRTARRAARDLDRRAEKFVRTLHRVDVNDPHQYDIVLDSESLGLSIAAELIVRAVELGRPERTPCLSSTSDKPPQQPE
jgi:cytidylate kinase